jgi:RNA polymerase sigma factor (sigma-70 family)
MNNLPLPQNELIAEAFNQYHEALVGYINRRINDMNQSEDIAQDVFLRLLEYPSMLRKETIKSFIFTIAQNRIVDLTRNYYYKNKQSTYMYDTVCEASYVSVEQNVIASDLLKMERKLMEALPEKRCRIYEMTRFEDKDNEEIAKELNLSKRTVEWQQFTARKEIRENMRKII